MSTRLVHRSRKSDKKSRVQKRQKASMIDQLGGGYSDKNVLLSFLAWFSHSSLQNLRDAKYFMSNSVKGNKQYEKFKNNTLSDQMDR
jgi:hypothetical protein